MAAKSPTIAVIGGTGAEGSAIALRLGHAGYRVTIGTRDLAKGARATAELNDLLESEAISFAGNAVAAASAEIVILTVPYAAQEATVQDIRAGLDGKILIDATAPLMPPKVSNVQLPQGAQPSPIFSACWATRLGWCQHFRTSRRTSFASSRLTSTVTSSSVATMPTREAQRAN